MTVTTTHPRLMTIEEFEALPQDGKKYELLWGELISVSPNYDHTSIVSRFIEELAPYLRQHGLGKVGPEPSCLFVTDRPLLLIPDAAYFRAERVPRGEERKGFIRVVPDLVFEALSPSETAMTMGAKVAAYLDQGVRLVVVADPDRQEIALWFPERTARVLRSPETLDLSEVVPGFRLPVATLFED